MTLSQRLEEEEKKKRKAVAQKEEQRQIRRAKRRLIRLAAVEAMTGLKKSEIYDRMKKGLFPAQVQLAPTPGKAVAWVESEVLDYIESLIARRDSKKNGRAATK